MTEQKMEEKEIVSYDRLETLEKKLLKIKEINPNFKPKYPEATHIELEFYSLGLKL